MPEVAILVTAKDQASATLGKVGGSLGKLGKAASVMGLAGVAALGGIAVGATKLALDAAKLEPTRVTFDNLSKSIGSTADAMLKKLRPATMGVVADADLMQAANKLMAMGLAETEDEAAKLSEMAVKLGTAMGYEATASMENFALMLANQSIPRLDSFGISAGKVRERINELMEADKSLTREQAFLAAVMEQGEVAMGRVGDISKTSAVTMAQFGATVDNLKLAVGNALLPVLKAFLDKVAVPLMNKMQELGSEVGERLGPFMTDLATRVGPLVSTVLGKVGEVVQKVGGWIANTLVPAIVSLVGWLVDNLGPIFKEFADEMAPRFRAVLETIGTFIRDTLIPALQNFWERTENIRESIVRFMGSAAVMALKGFLEGLVIVWDAVGRAIKFVVDMIIWLIEKIKEVIEWIKRLAESLPDWLRPGSASPLELSIKGIGEAFDELARVPLGTAAMAPATVGEGGLTIINYGTIELAPSEADRMSILEQLGY